MAASVDASGSRTSGKDGCQKMRHCSSENPMLCIERGGQSVVNSTLSVVTKLHKGVSQPQELASEKPARPLPSCRSRCMHSVLILHPMSSSVNGFSGTEDSSATGNYKEKNSLKAVVTAFCLSDSSRPLISKSIYIFRLQGAFRSGSKCVATSAAKQLVRGCS
jgi:hypothetical protein